MAVPPEKNHGDGYAQPPPTSPRRTRADHAAQAASAIAAAAASNGRLRGIP
eukprot:gene192-7907_t